MPTAARRHRRPQTPAELAGPSSPPSSPPRPSPRTDNVKVAGRTAYEVVLTPDDPATLVGSATLTVDSETGVPLKVVVAAKGQADPAFSVGFTSVDFSAPSSDVFAFTPPAGADVTEAPRHGATTLVRTTPTARRRRRPSLGSGWSTIVGLAPPRPTGACADRDAADDSSALLDQVLTPVDGGRCCRPRSSPCSSATTAACGRAPSTPDALQAAVAAQ